MQNRISNQFGRLLLSQEKQLRREYAKQQIYGTILSLDAICDSGDIGESTWMQDMHQNIDADILWSDIKADFCKVLTPNQLSVFNECLIAGKSQTAYAAMHGISIPMHRLRTGRYSPGGGFTEQCRQLLLSHTDRRPHHFQK